MSNSLRPHGMQHPRLHPVHHQLPELTQTHVHRVGDAIQPSHPLSSPSPLNENQERQNYPVFNFLKKETEGKCKRSSNGGGVGAEGWL